MKRALLIAAFLAAAVRPGWSMTEDQRKDYVAKLLQILPPAPAFTQWHQRTGELPPDFDALPKNNSLPDPLTFLDGRPVKTPDDWKARRAEMIRLFEKYDVGTIPPKPAIDSITPVDPAQAATAPARGAFPAGPGRGPAVEGALTKIADLKYGPDGQITTRVTLTIPPGEGPFPVFIGGSPAAVARGYIVCTFPMSVDAPPDIGRLYPNYDWGSMGKIAWTTQVVIDYLLTLPQVDKKHIAVTGYSRDGKRALITAALDERIAAVVPGSTGVGGAMPWRDGSERGFGESIESTTRSFPLWFTPRLRYFSGREDRLPVDGNLLMALVAPRACLLIWGNNDEVSQPWPMEHSYRSALKAYDFTGKPEALSVLHIPGTHGANDLARTMDWLDIQFGRSDKKWTNDLTFTYDHGQWLKDSGESLDLSRYAPHALADPLLAPGATRPQWEAQAADIRKSVTWMLGEKNPAPPSIPLAASTFDPERFAIQQHAGSCGWLQPQAGQTASRRITFANGVKGDLYYPAAAPAGARLPTVVWLHGYSYSLGYMWVYHSDLHPILALVRAGYAVLAFDQTGFGTRMNESAARYQLNPHWSQLGQMIEDTRAGIDAVQKDALVDPEKIYLYGYSMGGMLALHTAALDPRVKGVVSIAGFTPMRGDTVEKGAGGLARYALDRELLPRAGFFVGNETKVPYDFDGLIASIAPRPVYIVQPALDRDANTADVRAAVDNAARVFALYEAGDRLALDEPWDYNRLPNAIQDKAIKWMTEKMK